MVPRTSLLDYLETVPIEGEEVAQEMRFPVQYVIRPTLDFRGYAGQIAAGRIRPGDPVWCFLRAGRAA